MIQYVHSQKLSTLHAEVVYGNKWIVPTLLCIT